MDIWLNVLIICTKFLYIIRQIWSDLELLGWLSISSFYWKSKFEMAPGFSELSSSTSGVKQVIPVVSAVPINYPNMSVAVGYLDWSLEHQILWGDCWCPGPPGVLTWWWCSGKSTAKLQSEPSIVLDYGLVPPRPWKFQVQLTHWSLRDLDLMRF